MRIGVFAGATRIALIGPIAWVTLGAPIPARERARASDGPTPAQSREGASAVPCDVPLGWRVTRVDTPFGLSLEDATTLVGEAAALWNAVVDVPLFRHDPSGGFPVRLVFDERQQRTNARLEAERDLESVARSLAEERDALGRRDDALQRAREEYEAEARLYDRRLAAHNETIRRWNEGGGAPREVARRLEEAGRDLAHERRALRQRNRDLQGELDSLAGHRRRLDERTLEHTEGMAELERAFPMIGVESGVYREAVRRGGAEGVSVSREIRIYRFADADELRLLAAHELGHALGIGHSQVADAVMSGEQGGAYASGPSALHADDVARLRDLCPALGVAR